MEATTKDLRLNTPVLLAATDRGESVIITYRGSRRAVLRRWEDHADRAHADERNPAFGLWADESENVDQQVRRLSQPRALPSCWLIRTC